MWRHVRVEDRTRQAKCEEYNTVLTSAKDEHCTTRLGSAQLRELTVRTKEVTHHRKMKRQSIEYRMLQGHTRLCRKDRSTRPHVTTRKIDASHLVSQWLLCLSVPRGRGGSKQVDKSWIFNYLPWYIMGFMESPHNSRGKCERHVTTIDTFQSNFDKTRHNV